MTKEQEKINNRNHYKARIKMNVPKGYTLHHKDPSWRHDDIERYIQWNLEDLVIMSNSEHSRFHGLTRQWSEETRKKISTALTGKHLSEEHKRNISEACKGRKLSEETKKKMSESKNGNQATKGMKWYTNGVKSIRLKPDDIIPEGFYLGRLYSRSN